MRRNASIRLVIDANIAHSAGPEGATHPTARQCRDVLDAVEQHGYCVASTAALREEWRRHRSGHWRRWFVKMMAQRRVKSLTVEPDEALRRKLDDCAGNEGEREAMRKDYHLLEAALAADDRILSCEDRVRRHYANACRTVGEIRHLVWVNPTNAADNALPWLEAGAPLEAPRRLRNYL
jgi:hypothetical protein